MTDTKLSPIILLTTTSAGNKFGGDPMNKIGVINNNYFYSNLPPEMWPPVVDPWNSIFRIF